MSGCVLGVSLALRTVVIRRARAWMYATGVRNYASAAHIHSVSIGLRGILLSGQNGG